MSDVALSKKFSEPLMDIRGRSFEGVLRIPGLWELLKGLFTGGVELGFSFGSDGWGLFDRVYAGVVGEKEEKDRKELKRDLKEKRQSNSRRF